MKATSVAELVRSAQQPDLAAMPPGGELEPRQRVDGHRIRVDAAHVTHATAAPARLEQRADALAETGEVRRCDRAPDSEADGGLLVHLCGFKTISCTVNHRPVLPHGLIGEVTARRPMTSWGFTLS